MNEIPARLKMARSPGKFPFTAWFSPPLVTFLALLVLVSAVLAAEHGDPLALARLGTFYSQQDPGGTQGYDGQFIYYIARDLDPRSVSAYLDVPAYRFQRILLPLIARLFSFGNPELLPWVLILLGILSQVAGVWIVAELLVGWHVSRWYALVYGLWAGFTLALRLDLPEPLAYALVAGAILGGDRNRPRLSWLLYALALFAKEVTIFFVAAALLFALLQRDRRALIGLTGVALLPYLAFQGWLWFIFGQPGIGSGGALATSFEWIPFMGLWRISGNSFAYMLAMLVVFAPTVILPCIWGLWISLRTLISGKLNVVVLALFLNAAIIPFLPFSTFRETGGLIRFVCGLVLAVLLFAARYRMLRVLNYTWFWLVLNVFLVKPDIS